MRILMLSGAYPLPVDNGSKRRILSTATYMSQHHDVTLFSLRENKQLSDRSTPGGRLPWLENILNIPGRGRLEVALKACFSGRSYAQLKYWYPNFESLLNDHLADEKYDCIWVNFLCMTQYIENNFSPNISEKIKPLPLFVLDQHNVDELYFKSFLKSQVNIAWKLFALVEMIKARQIQRRWYPRYDAILSVSSEDVARTCAYCRPFDKPWLAPNGVDVDYFKPPSASNSETQSSILVFGASFDVTMNVDAVFWFAQNVLPLIRRQIPGVQFWIVGRDPPARVRRLSEQPGTCVTGTVPDVRDFYSQASVFVVPLRVGGGTKLKTLEAMAMGLPVVSTTVGSQGLEVESGRHLCIADNPEDFKNCAVDLLTDRKKALGIGAEARKLVEQKYSWSRILEDVDRRLIALYEGRKNISREAFTPTAVRAPRRRSGRFLS